MITRALHWLRIIGKPSTFPPSNHNNSSHSETYITQLAITTHEGESDPHTGYQKESEKGNANGYAALGSGGYVPPSQLGSGTPDSSVALFGDNVWRSPGAGSVNIKQVELDFGSTPVVEKEFTIVDGDVSVGSQLIAQVAYEAPTGKDFDELEFNDFHLKCKPESGGFKIFAIANGRVYGNFKFNYLIG